MIIVIGLLSFTVLVEALVIYRLLKDELEIRDNDIWTTTEIGSTQFIDPISGKEKFEKAKTVADLLQ